MKKFKSKSKRKEKVDWMILIILFTTIILLHYYNKNISHKIINLAETKIEEITNLYVKKNIVPKDINIEKLILVYQNSNEEIISVDVDMQYANNIMVDVVKKIQNNIFELTYDEDEILKKYNDNLYITVPITLSDNGSLFSNIGPKIPIMITFYEHAFGNVDVELTDYGINNALLKVYLTISIEQKMLIPYKEKKFNKIFSVLLGVKIINGTVPNIYGNSLKKSSSIIETS